jgi:hypothetical protein
MKSDEYLILAEIEYWRDTIDGHLRKVISRPQNAFLRETIADMSRSLSRAEFRLALLRNPAIPAENRLL